MFCMWSYIHHINTTKLNMNRQVQHSFMNRDIEHWKLWKKRVRLCDIDLVLPQISIQLMFYVLLFSQKCIHIFNDSYRKHNKTELNLCFYEQKSNYLTTCYELFDKKVVEKRSLSRFIPFLCMHSPNRSTIIEFYTQFFTKFSRFPSIKTISFDGHNIHKQYFHWFIKNKTLFTYQFLL